MGSKGKTMEAIISIAGQIDPSLAKTLKSVTSQFSGIAPAAKKMGIVATAGVATITTAAIAATAELYKLGTEFEKAKNTIRVGTGAVGDDLDALYQDMKDVYSSVPTTMDDASTAIADYNTRLGLTGEPLQDLSKQAIQVSKLLGEDLSTTIEESSQAFQQWNIDTEDMSKEMDYIFKTSQSTGTGFNVLMSDLQSYGTQFQELGYDFETTAALIGNVEKSGYDVSAVLSGMKKAVKNLADEGIDATTGLQAYYEKIQNAESATEAISIATDVFGAAAGSTMAAAIRDGTMAVDDLVASLNASGETIAIASEDTYTFADKLSLLKQKAQTSLEPIASKIVDIANEALPLVADAFETIMPVISDLGTALVPIIQEASQNILPIITDIIQTVLPPLQDLAIKIVPVLSKVIQGAGKIMQKVFGYVGKILPTLIGFGEKLGSAFADLFVELGPTFDAIFSTVGQVIEGILPVIGALIDALMPLMPVVSTILQAVAPIVSMIGTLASHLFPMLATVINALVPVITWLSNVFNESIGTVLNSVVIPCINDIMTALGAVCDFISNVFAGNWDAAWQNIVTIFSSTFSAIEGLAKAPINAVISGINSVINGINGMNISIPDWVPGLGGQTFALDIPNIPMLATGGYTNGPTIAGEEATEAVISFDPSYREENLSYWARAGRMLGVDEGYLDGIVGNTSGNGGGITINFAPKITINGSGDVKEDLISQLKQNEEELMDMIEEMLNRRGDDEYGYAY